MMRPAGAVYVTWHDCVDVYQSPVHTWCVVPFSQPPKEPPMVVLVLPEVTAGHLIAPAMVGVVVRYL